MNSTQVDAYLAALDPAARSTLQTVRERILQLAPGAEECMSYGMPGYKLQFGKKWVAFAGYAAFKNHLSYFPHSGQVSGALAEALAGYKLIPSGVQFARDEPLPLEVIRILIEERLDEIRRREESRRAQE